MKPGTNEKPTHKINAQNTHYEEANEIIGMSQRSLEMDETQENRGETTEADLALPVSDEAQKLKVLVFLNSGQS